MKTLLSTSLLALLSLSAAAQSAASPTFKSTCDANWTSWMGNRQKGFCETRDLTLPAPATGQKLAIDGRRNGGITVRGWDGPDVRVRAQVQAWGGSETAAQTQAKAIKISSAGNTLRADAGTGDDQWSVSYEVFVPRQTALALTTHNGGIRIENVQAPITFEAKNGGIHLAGLGGDVRGTTTNGGVHVTLTGTEWTGKGLDVTTTNGGITWHIPEAYSAQLKTQTQHGGLTTDYPVTVSGKIGRSLDTKLGQGGAPVSVVTTNGGILLRRATAAD